MAGGRNIKGITVEIDGNVTGLEKALKSVNKTISDKHGNPIKYEATNSGRVYTKSAWNVRGHMRTLKDGRKVPVRPYPKGKERNNPNAVNPKQYVFDDQKIEADSE